MERCKDDYEILVIDTEKVLDDTPKVCKQYGVRYVNQEEPYFGGAFRTGIKYASKDKFLIMDSDGSHPPRYIVDIYKMFVQNKCDVVIGSRYVKGGVTNDSQSSQVMSKILNTTFRIFLGIKAKDISTDYRMYDTKQLSFSKRLYGESKRQLMKFIISYIKTLVYLTGIRLKHVIKK